ncbi:DUF3021 family protein [uncultured Oscillibacter sp.]|uniref:DUF3021 family protein n=1 Tax=uncultured Oscillibacter sp. TaxID=876091 RepID=UPI00262D5BF7|nr:DUF3021 family protein [uncultured Oscillibacter sp.]
MNEDRSILRELVRQALIGFPLGAAAVYLIILLGNHFAWPAPTGVSLYVVTEALADRWGNPATAALVQFFWSGVLGAALKTAGVPFLLERRTALWSAVHLLATAAVFSLAGWRCRWFSRADPWALWTGVLLLCYLTTWAVRYVGWRQDLLALRRAAGLAETPERTVTQYVLLAAAVGLALPWVLRCLDPVDVPLLTGIFYPFLILPLFCFFSACSLGRRWGWRRALRYAAWCAALPVLNVALLYNYTALFQVLMAGVPALAGGLLGALLRRLKKS